MPLVFLFAEMHPDIDVVLLAILSLERHLFLDVLGLSLIVADRVGEVRIRIPVLAAREPVEIVTLVEDRWHLASIDFCEAATSNLSFVNCLDHVHLAAKLLCSVGEISLSDWISRVLVEEFVKRCVVTRDFRICGAARVIGLLFFYALTGTKRRVGLVTCCWRLGAWLRGRMLSLVVLWVGFGLRFDLQSWAYERHELVHILRHCFVDLLPLAA
ncbi:hypothetical protein EDD84_03620 [Burkholderia gladioli]|nr:hypothetical protein EDD84_03620 [Burkholderia gladioli]